MNNTAYKTILLASNNKFARRPTMPSMQNSSNIADGRKPKDLHSTCNVLESILHTQHIDVYVSKRISLLFEVRLANGNECVGLAEGLN